MALASEAMFAYSVERTARRTVGIYVERDGSVLVRAPEALADARIAEVVRSKADWILRAQARWAALNPGRARKEFVSGETVYFLGQPCRLDFRSDAKSASVFRSGDIFVLHSGDKERAEDLLKAFYRQEGLSRLPELVAQHSRSMGLTPKAVRVLELGHRWGSCSPGGTLNFNWKSVAVPIEVLHYLVVHELAHLQQRNHSPEFWRVVEMELPDWRRNANWLDLHGAQMTL